MSNICNNSSKDLSVYSWIVGIGFVKDKGSTYENNLARNHMKDNEFYLSAEIKYNCLDVVKMWGTDFELKVYSLTDTDYEVAENCIELYGKSNRELFAFEVSLDDELSYNYMNDGILWYTEHIGKPEMEVLRTDPRADFLEDS